MTIEETIRFVSSRQHDRVINHHCYGEVIAMYRTARKMVEDFAKKYNVENITIYWHREECFTLREISNEKYVPEEDYYFAKFEEDKE